MNVDKHDRSAEIKRETFRAITVEFPEAEKRPWLCLSIPSGCEMVTTLNRVASRAFPEAGCSYEISSSPIAYLAINKISWSEVVALLTPEAKAELAERYGITEKTLQEISAIADPNHLWFDEFA